jgi:predicted metal-dependent HD superfamily phosphohydrolase
MDSSNSLVEKAASTVRSLLQRDLPAWSVYHGLSHTIETVHTCKELALDSALDAGDLEILLIAAWFHDTGYLEGAEGHEDRSVARATEFLRSNGGGEATIAKVVSAILSTRMPQSPGSLIEEILCDADVSHVGREDFLAKSELLRKEMEGRLGRSYEDGDWYRFNLAFLEKHSFHTTQARARLGVRRRENITLMKGKLEQAA